MSNQDDEQGGTPPTRIGFGRPTRQRPSGTAATDPAPISRPATPPPRATPSPGSSGHGGSVPWLEPGMMLGKYRIVGRLGAGGMGAVYEAVHADIAKPVALKTLSPSLAVDDRARKRFLREAEAASSLE